MMKDSKKVKISPSQNFAKNARLLGILLMAQAITVEANNELRVCAEPDNLPFSNRAQQGFENKIARILANDLHVKLRYTWEMQRQGYIRNTLGAERCDLIMGVPAGNQRTLTTTPYYRSSYVFVTAKKRHLAIHSYDDPVLRNLKIGLHSFGNDGSNSPPAHSLAHRGITDHIVNFSLWVDDSTSSKNPQAEIVNAVANGEIDLAIIWGPVAGYFAKPFGTQLKITAAPADKALPKQPFSFDIAIGVRKSDQAFAAKLEKSLQRKHKQIEEILAEYNIPIPDSVPTDSVGNSQSSS